MIIAFRGLVNSITIKTLWQIAYLYYGLCSKRETVGCLALREIGRDVVEFNFTSAHLCGLLELLL